MLSDDICISSLEKLCQIIEVLLSISKQIDDTVDDELKIQMII